MREHQKAKTDRVKRNRRQWLIALILAGSPCLAEEPQHLGLAVLPPLPLNATKAAPSVSTNPYCAPQNAAPQPQILLTTGASQTSHSAQLRRPGAIRIAWELPAPNGKPLHSSRVFDHVDVQGRRPKDKVLACKNGLAHRGVPDLDHATPTMSLLLSR